MVWQDKLDKTVKSHLEFQLKEVNKHAPAFLKAKEPSKAQLWVAVANLSKIISALNTKCKELENKITNLESHKVKKKQEKKILKKLKKR